MKAHSGQLENRRGRLHYQVCGQGPAIVLCHALGTDSTVWANLEAALSTSFTVINFDLRGHGRSEPAADADYSFEAMAGDVRSLLNHLGERSASLIGISVGGEVAQTFAAQYPDLTRDLVLCSTACVTEARRFSLWAQRIEEVETAGMESIAMACVTRWFTPEFRMKKTSTVELYRRRLANLAPQVYICMARTIQHMDLREAIRGIDCPTLVLCGDQDSNTGPEAARMIVENIGVAEFVLIEGAAHFPNLEAPDRFNSLVLGWLTARSSALSADQRLA